MATMSMNRVIHSAVRRDLGRFRGALDAFEDGDQGRAAGLHRAWQNFDAQLSEHHEGEHELAWPALLAVGVDEPTIDRFDDEHEAMAADLATARAAMGRLAATAARADAEAAAVVMARLEATTTTHLEHEEAVTEPALVQQHDHPALKEMSRKFRRRQSVGQTGTFMAWLQDGATPEERDGLRAHVPGPVLAVLTALFGRRYRREVAPVWAAPPS